MTETQPSLPDTWSEIPSRWTTNNPSYRLSQAPNGQSVTVRPNVIDGLSCWHWAVVSMGGGIVGAGDAATLHDAIQAAKNTAR